MIGFKALHLLLLCQVIQQITAGTTPKQPAARIVCPMIKCMAECFKGVDANGCNICNCENTCQTTKCPEGQKCVMYAVACVKAPCDQQPRQPQCVPNDEPKACPPKIVCKTPCEADIGEDGCYSKCSCPLTCNDIKCKANEKCEIVKKVCIRAPCFPDPTCFPKNTTTQKPPVRIEPKTCPPKIVCKESCVADFGEDGCYSKCSCPETCSDIKCKADEICELVQRFCFRAPCFPAPTCFPKNRTCGQSPNVNRCLDGKTFWIRWTFNSSTKSCESFRHYGCSPSPNTFNNRRQCMNTCVPVRSSCPPNTKMCMVNCYFGEKTPGSCPECICPCQTVRCSAGYECRLKEGICSKGERCNPTAYCASI